MRFFLRYEIGGGTSDIRDNIGRDSEFKTCSNYAFSHGPSMVLVRDLVYVVEFVYGRNLVIALRARVNGTEADKGVGGGYRRRCDAKIRRSDQRPEQERDCCVERSQQEGGYRCLNESNGNPRGIRNGNHRVTLLIPSRNEGDRMGNTGIDFPVCTIGR